MLVDPLSKPTSARLRARTLPDSKERVFNELSRVDQPLGGIVIMSPGATFNTWPPRIAVPLTSAPLVVGVDQFTTDLH